MAATSTGVHAIGLMLASPGDLAVLAEHFRERGHAVVLRDWSEGPPAGAAEADLWIVDELTARRFGKEFVALKRRSVDTLLPVLVALDPASDPTTWLNAGFDDVVRIPITKAELEARIGVFLRLREQIAERHELDQARLEWVVRQIPVGVVIAEAPSGRILRVNEPMRQLFGSPLEDDDAIDVYERLEGYRLDGSPYEPGEWPIMRTIRDGETVSDEEIVIERPDGSRGVVVVNSGPVRDRAGRVVAAVATAADVTELRHLLENERAARRDAEEANRLKDEFLTTVSHELRTPLNAIIGWMQIVKSHTLDAAGHARAMETIERNVRAQAQIVEDLLDISRIMTGRLRIEAMPVDPSAVVKAAVDSLMPAAANRGVKLRVAMDTSVRMLTGDPARLQQVVWNLVSNAIKFTPRGGRVQVDLEQTDAYTEIRVNDDGQGINPAFLPHVFERFRQADGSTTRKHGGLGIGLAIVREIVAVHGGTVEATSPGLSLGSTFIVRIPFPPGAAPDEPEGHRPPVRHSLGAHAEDSALAGIRVLLVEDDADSREMLDYIFGNHGAETDGCGSVEEALECFTRVRPDILVCDIGLPGADGYEMIRRVRASEDSGKRTPAIALTAYARVEDRVRALREGFDLHLAKPVEPSELVSAIRSLVGLA